MAIGMIDAGNRMKSNALEGMRRLTELEKARKDAEKQMDRQDEMDKRSNQMTTAGLGSVGGFAVGGPVGAAIGAGVGFLAGSLF